VKMLKNLSHPNIVVSSLSILTWLGFLLTVVFDMFDVA
jgi:hypothetical protein